MRSAVMASHRRGGSLLLQQVACLLRTAAGAPASSADPSHLLGLAAAAAARQAPSASSQWHAPSCSQHPRSSWAGGGPEPRAPPPLLHGASMSTAAAAARTSRRPSQSKAQPPTASKLLSKTVQVVLLQDVWGLGRRGEVKAANPGWVRHQLFPRGAALYATPENVAKYARSQEEQARSRDPDLAMEKEVTRMLRILAHRVVEISRKAIPAVSGGSEDAPASSSPSSGTAAADKDASSGGGALSSLRMRGSVTPWDLMQAVLRQTGIQLHESHLLLTTPLTTFGTFKVPLNLRMLDGHQVELNIEVNPVKEVKAGKTSS